MRCTRCGNENPDQNRFCGMCGASLLTAPETAAAEPQRVPAAVTTAAAESGSPKAPLSETPRAATSASDDTLPISGPSFLGLSDPPERKRASLSLDSHDAPRSVDYLLDDEEEHHKSSGAGKFFLILFALALVVGLGYLRWKDHGFGWIGQTGKPSAAHSATDANTTTSSPNTTPNSHAAPSQAPATQTPPDSSAAAGTSTTSPAGTPSAPPSTAAGSDTTKPADPVPPAADGANGTAPPADAAPKQPANTSAPSDSTDRPKPAPPPPTKPRPAIVKPAAPVDRVAEAEKYLYGRGVAQDCDRGMRLLKPIADQSNPKAMIEMGALYSAGLCTPHDLPTAYRWFAMALRQDPNNDAVQADLQKLWGEMTQPERQLAIKMTQ